MMSQIEQQITFLYTRDLETTHQFYAEAFGFRLVVDQGACRIYHVAGSAYLGFCQRADAPDPAFNRANRSVIFTLVTQDVDGWHARLAAQGIAFEKAPAFAPEYQIYHAFLRDPNGYLLEIQRFLDEHWFNPQTG